MTKLILIFVCLAIRISCILSHQELRLVNLISRHGDRAPVGPLPNGDKHAEKVEVFWPNGLGNMTEEGTSRMKSLALSLRSWYQHLKSWNMLKTDEPSFLALSSSVQRCKDSMMTFLEAFYGSQHSYPRDSPTNPEPYDTKLVPSLDYHFITRSPYVKAHPNRRKSDLLEDEIIGSTFGVKRLMEVLRERYDITRLDNTALNIFSTIMSEMQLDHDKGLSDYSDHYSWTSEVLLRDTETGNTITLLEVFSRVTLLGYLNQLDANAAHLISAPIITSVVESMQVQIVNAHDQPKPTWRQFAYKDRDLILYSSHDTIMTRVLVDMGIIKLDTSEPFERQLMRLKNSNSSDVDLYLSGMSMAHFGLSVRFSLWKVADGDKYIDWLVRLDVYNEPDWSKPAEYQPVKLGKFCVEQYGKKFGENTIADIRVPLEYDEDYDCKFDVFKKILNEKLLNEDHYKNIYNDIRI